MATLNGQPINTSYSGLIKTNDNGTAGTSGLKQLSDGQGNLLPIEVSQEKIVIANGNIGESTGTSSIVADPVNQEMGYLGNHNFTAATVTGLPSGGGFEPVVLSGTTQSLDLGQYNFFKSQLTDNVTLSFTNVPTEKEFQYSFSGFAPYVVSQLTYQQTKSIGRDAQSMHFKPDGTQVYFITDGGTDNVSAHNLSVAWDISTLSSTPIATFSFTAQATAARGLTMSPDGTKMYITAESINTAFEYTLSTAFDISTASYSGNSLAGIINQPWGTFIKPDGTSLFVSGGGGTVEQWNLSTAFNLSTATLFGSYNTTFSGTQGVTLNANGTKIYTVSSESDTVYGYDLSTPYNITTLVNNNEKTYIGVNATDPYDIFFKSNGTELYVINNSTLQEYESIGAPVVTLPASVQNPPTNPPVIAVNQSVTYTFFTLDGGTTVFLSGDNNQNIVYTPGIAVGVGANSMVSKLTSTAASATGTRTIAIGNGALATNTDGIAIGNNAQASGGSATLAIAIGTDVRITRDTGIAIGKNLQQSTSTNDFYRPVVLGFNSNVRGGDSIGIGSNVEVTGTGTNHKIAIGNGAQVSDVNGGVAIGEGVVCSTANTVTIKRLQMLDYATLNFADDTAAAAGGIPLGGVYHTSGALKIRIA